MGMSISVILIGKEENTSLSTFFFPFLECVLRSATLINFLSNGLLSGWETERIPQFTSLLVLSGIPLLDVNTHKKKSLRMYRMYRMSAWYAHLICRYPEVHYSLLCIYRSTLGNHNRHCESIVLNYCKLLSFSSHSASDN